MIANILPLATLLPLKTISSSKVNIVPVNATETTKGSEEDEDDVFHQSDRDEVNDKEIIDLCDRDGINDSSVDMGYEISDKLESDHISNLGDSVNTELGNEYDDDLFDYQLDNKDIICNGYNKEDTPIARMSRQMRDKEFKLGVDEKIHIEVG